MKASCWVQRSCVPRRTHPVFSRDRENDSDPFKRKLGKMITHPLYTPTTPAPRKNTLPDLWVSRFSGKAVRAGLSPTSLNSQSPSTRGADSRFPGSAGLPPSLSGTRTGKLPTNRRRSHTWPVLRQFFGGGTAAWRAESQGSPGGVSSGRRRPRLTHPCPGKEATPSECAQEGSS